MTTLEELRVILREDDIPFFTDEQLEYYLNKNGGNVDLTAYECLGIKAEDTSLSITGFSTGDTSKYFKRMAQKYRPNNSGILKGVY